MRIVGLLITIDTGRFGNTPEAVSYKHLTLPTNYSVQYFVVSVSLNKI